MNWLLSLFLSPPTCTLAMLRGVNVLLGGSQFYLLKAILKELHPDMDHVSLLLRSATLFLFPLQFFYNFLYYTDAGSTFFVLLAYLLVLKQRPHWAALAGAAGVLFRQTNIVWLALALTASLVRWTHQALLPRRRPPASLSDLADIIAAVLMNPLRVIRAYGTGLLVGASFVVFVFYNGALVVGDRSHHQAARHFPQLLYFLAVAAAALHIRLLSALQRLKLRALTSLPSLLFLVVALFFVRRYSYAHPYLLADNRHYSFYLWRLLTRSPYRPYAAVLLYWLAAHLIANLSYCTSALLNALYIGALAAVLVPSPLIELRYFALPFLVLSLHLTPVPHHTSLPFWKRHFIDLFDICCCVLVNLAVLYVFLYRPFTWPTGQEARFMW